MSKKRPIGIWVIALYYLFSTFFLMCSMACIALGVIPLPVAGHVTVSGQECILFITIFFLEIMGATALIFLRKQALVFFAVAWLLGTSNVIWRIFSNAKIPGEDAGVGATSLGLAVGFIACLYIWSLTRKGLLE